MPLFFFRARHGATSPLVQSTSPVPADSALTRLRSFVWIHVRVVAMCFVGLSFAFLTNAKAIAQPPGTMPPADLLRAETPWSGDLQGIRPEAFLFQDESNTAVVMPRMSFEEIDRLRKRDRGMQSGDPIATLERITITGQVDGNRAAMKAVLMVRLDPLAIRQTGASAIKVELGLSGCHLLEPADIRFSGDPRTSQPSVRTTSDPLANIPGAYVRLTPSANVDLSSGRGVATDSNAPVPGPVGYQLVLPTKAFESRLNGEAAGEPTNQDNGFPIELPSLAESSEILVAVELQLSNRVQPLSPRQAAMAMRLPVVSTLMTFELVEPRFRDNVASLASLEVSGNGPDVVRRIEASDRFTIECGGGDLMLQWSAVQESVRDAGDLLEVESETEVQWESPGEPLSIDSRLVTRNLRGALRSFEVLIPENAVLLSPPEVSSVNDGARETNGVSPSVIPSSATIGNPQETPWEIQVIASPELTPSKLTPSKLTPSEIAKRKTKAATGTETRFTRVLVRWSGSDVAAAPSSAQLRLKLRQVATDATANSPWTLSIPQVDRSIGHRGFVTIRTPEDHRLRWRPKLGIDAVLSTSLDQSSNDLVYPFRFSQTQFELPLWLSGKQEQLRLTTDVDLEVNRQVSLVNLSINAGGSGIDPKGLQLELGGWKLRDIRAIAAKSSSASSSATSQNTSLEITEEDSIVRWQVDTSDGKWPSQYKITAERPFVDSSLELPRLVSTEASTVVTDVNVSIMDGRRETWLVDLAASPALQRIDSSKQSQFRIISPENAWSVQGEFVSQPLQVDWSSAIVVSQTGDQWLTRSAWTLTSSVNLEGRLRFTMPPGWNDVPEIATSDDDSIDPRWAVTVNGSPAVVRYDRKTRTPGETDATKVNKDSPVTGNAGTFGDRDVWEIVSPELDFGPHRIELEIKQSIVSREASPVSANTKPLANQALPANTSLADGSPNGRVTSNLLLPVPLADRLTVSSPITLQLPRGISDVDGLVWQPTADFNGILSQWRATGDFQFEMSKETDANTATVDQQWSFARAPEFPIPILLRSSSDDEKVTEIPRSFLRSLIGKRYRHEHLLALVREGRRVCLGLPTNLDAIRVEVRLDGLPIDSYTRDATGLRIDLPESGIPPTTTNPPPTQAIDARRDQLLDVRIWTETEDHPWWTQIEPMLRLPVASGLQYWQLVVPNDSHLFWASSQSGRAMRWEQTGLRLARYPSITDAALIRWTSDAGWDLTDSSPDVADGKTDQRSGEAELTADSAVSGDELTLRMIRDSLRDSSFSVPGNRYLFFAGSSFSFSALTISRTMLWLIVGGLVLVLALAFEWFPRLHHPLAAFGLAIGMLGVLIVAPDGVVLSAQLVMIALCLVAVFYAVSAISGPRNPKRVLSPSRPGNGSQRNGSQRNQSTDSQDASKQSRSETNRRLNRRQSDREVPQDPSRKWATTGVGTTREYDSNGNRNGEDPDLDDVSKTNAPEAQP